ncbi:helix-turn-helix domain-containing protein [Methylobacter psychrophilus]|uniref:helix-turn-helix domain-containing protein n=1 Tax=Methylobacter psychrophilus TaxID=96941 RepID=UPI0021D4E0EB|nr:helix-turn-helix domain-containing protein [Methylobacter psychrophilus]
MSQKIVTLQSVIDSLEILTRAVLSNKQTLNLEEAAAFTGLATSYLYKLTSTQEIPHYKPRGKMLYFDRSELETWLRQGRVKSIAEIERQAVNHIVGPRVGA